MIDLRHILVPTDFSKFSLSAVTYAAAFAEKFGASLSLLHVVQNVNVVMPELGTVPALTPPEDLMTVAAREALQKLITDHQLARFAARAAVRAGVAYHEIVEYAREAAVDLIVVGTHGHSGLVHMLMGSVAEKVVRLAPCPVLTVRHPEHEFVHP